MSAARAATVRERAAAGLDKSQLPSERRTKEGNKPQLAFGWYYKHQIECIAHETLHHQKSLAYPGSCSSAPPCSQRRLRTAWRTAAAESWSASSTDSSCAWPPATSCSWPPATSCSWPPPLTGHNHRECRSNALSGSRCGPAHAAGKKSARVTPRPISRSVRTVVPISEPSRLWLHRCVRIPTTLTPASA